MSTDLINTALLAGAFLALFGLAEILYHYMKVKVELTRKLVHIGTGLLTLLFPVMLDNHWMVLLLCSSFAVILLLSLRFNLLRSINAIDRESVGSIAYPVAVYGCYLAYHQYYHQYIYFYLPILILAICDPIAALTGKTWPKGKYRVGADHKTVMGSFMFFLSAALLCTLLFIELTAANDISFIATGAITIGLATSLTEALSRKGYDNITIPASALAALILFYHFFGNGGIE